MRTKETIQQEVLLITCDRCKTNRTNKSCGLCGRDLCTKCAYFTEDLTYTMEDIPDHYSDYPTYVCKECWITIRPLRLEYAIKLKNVKDALEKVEAEFIMKAQGIVK